MKRSELALDLKSALLGTGLIQPITSKVAKGKLEVLGRQVPGQQAAWLKVVETLVTSVKSPWLHVCRRYLEKDGRMVFGWHLGVDAPNQKVLTQVVREVFETVLAKSKDSPLYKNSQEQE